MKLTAEEMLELFVHRSDVFATQQKNGAYYPTKRPITIDDIKSHLKGEVTLGVYCLNTDNTVKWACIDIDLKEINRTELRRVKEDAEFIYSMFGEFSRMLEVSGRRGYHIWIFFKHPINASYVQRMIKSWLNRLKLNKYEVFPKQTELNENRKYGNLVKLPLGLHKKSGKFSKILKFEEVK
jgi:hypothetical protein